MKMELFSFFLFKFLFGTNGWALKNCSLKVNVFEVSTYKFLYNYVGSDKLFFVVFLRYTISKKHLHKFFQKVTHEKKMYKKVRTHAFLTTYFFFTTCTKFVIFALSSREDENSGNRNIF